MKMSKVGELFPRDLDQEGRLMRGGRLGLGNTETTPYLFPVSKFWLADLRQPGNDV